MHLSSVGDGVDGIKKRLVFLRLYVVRGVMYESWNLFACGY